MAMCKLEGVSFSFSLRRLGLVYSYFFLKKGIFKNSLFVCGGGWSYNALDAYPRPPLCPLGCAVVGTIIPES